MKELNLTSTIQSFGMEELTNEERLLVEAAITATNSSYAPYSHFHVGAAVLLANGEIIPGCNQENAVLPAGICAERSAIFSAGAQYPEQPILMLAIAARDTKGELTKQPVSPCGICRQVIVEVETRFNQPVRILLYGQESVYVIDGIRKLVPLTFSEF
ncbi:MAG: cytidine deaminase [Prevotella sp.]|nr:cytidine deaminase [Prevotella sp.]